MHTDIQFLLLSHQLNYAMTNAASSLTFILPFSKLFIFKWVLVTTVIQTSSNHVYSLSYPNHPLVLFLKMAIFKITLAAWHSECGGNQQQQLPGKNGRAQGTTDGLHAEQAFGSRLLWCHLLYAEEPKSPPRMVPRAGLGPLCSPWAAWTPALPVCLATQSLSLSLR